MKSRTSSAFRPMVKTALVVGLLATASSSVADAQPKKQPAAPTVECTLYEVSLENTKTPKVDADLKPLEKKLAKPPFSSWNTQTKLTISTKTLEKTKPEAYPVKVGKASIMFDSMASKSQVTLAIQIDNGAGKRILDTKINISGADFFMTSREEGKTQHLLALTCK